MEPFLAQPAEALAFARTPVPGIQLRDGRLKHRSRKYAIRQPLLVGMFGRRAPKADAGYALL